MDNEKETLLQRLEDNTTLLGSGWQDRVEYYVPAKYHGPGCTRGADCQCEMTQEKRVRTIRRPSLLEQLRQFQQNKDTDRNPKAERGAPRVKTAGKPPGDMAGFYTLDEITCDAYRVLDRVFEEAGRDRRWLVEQPLAGVFNKLAYQVSQFYDARPDLAREVLKATDKWVRQAKHALKVTVSEAMFNDTVCGNCGGGLAIAWDNQSDVRCVGKPTEPPCGETYPMTEWLNLYEKGKRR